MDKLKQTKLWLPSILGFGTAFLCMVPQNEGAILPQRPPAIVFMIIWPILYILLGLSWSNSNEKYHDISHSITTLLLTLWLITYACLDQKKIGLYIIACSIASVVSSMCLHLDKLSVLLLTPLLAWLLIAFLLN